MVILQIPYQLINQLADHQLQKVSVCVRDV